MAMNHTDLSTIFSTSKGVEVFACLCSVGVTMAIVAPVQIVVSAFAKERRPISLNHMDVSPHH